MTWLFPTAPDTGWDQNEANQEPRVHYQIGNKDYSHAAALRADPPASEQTTLDKDLVAPVDGDESASHPGT